MEILIILVTFGILFNLAGIHHVLNDQKSILDKLNKIEEKIDKKL